MVTAGIGYFVFVIEADIYARDVTTPVVSVTSAVDLCGVCHLPNHAMTWRHHEDLLSSVQRCWLLESIQKNMLSLVWK